MAEIRKSLRCCGILLRRDLGGPKMWLIVVMMVVFSFYNYAPLCTIADFYKVQVAPWAYPFFLSFPTMQVVNNGLCALGAVHLVHPAGNWLGRGLGRVAAHPGRVLRASAGTDRDEPVHHCFSGGVGNIHAYRSNFNQPCLYRTFGGVYGSAYLLFQSVRQPPGGDICVWGSDGNGVVRKLPGGVYLWEVAAICFAAELVGPAGDRLVP